jgi:HEAT repeat protein
MPKLFLYALVLQFALAALLTAQVENTGCGRMSGFGCNGNCEGEPAEEHMLAPILLKRLGVPITRYDLLLALTNPDPQVRYLAGWSLADQDAKGNTQPDYLSYFANQNSYVGWSADDANQDIRDIADAIDAERDPRTKIYLACALSEFEDSRAVQVLQSSCEDTTFPPQVRLDAAIFLMELHQRPCISGVTEAVKQMGLSDGMRSTWFLIANLHELYPDEYLQLRSNLLNDEPHLLYAVNLILGLRDVSSLPDVEAAIPRQTDPLDRDRLEGLITRIHEMERWNNEHQSARSQTR